MLYQIKMKFVLTSLFCLCFRLDEMMESDRVRVLSEYEQRDTTKRFERLKGAQVLHQQIEENEQTRLLEQEKKDQETKVR